jgi:hypothetical protein
MIDHRPRLLGWSPLGGKFIPSPQAPDTIRAPRADIRAKDWKSLVEWTDVFPVAAMESPTSDPEETVKNLSVFMREWLLLHYAFSLTGHAKTTHLRGNTRVSLQQIREINK